MLFLDCDGPLGDFVGSVAPLVGLPDWKPVPHWYFMSNLEETHRKGVVARFREPGFARTIPVVPGAQRGVDRLRRELRRKGSYVRVGVLTAPVPKAPTWEADRLWWLAHHFGFEPSDVTFAADKRPYAGRTFLDDHLDNVRGWSLAQGRRAWLWETPHMAGQNVDYPHRVADWEQAAEVLLAEAFSSAA